MNTEKKCLDLVQVFYSDDYINTDIIGKSNKSIFLAGPTPRSNDIKSWRYDAISILKDLGFNGTIFIPEPKNGFKHSYIDQIEWEESGLKLATVIAFWVPRDINNGMPGFTTNDEWGFWKNSGKVVWGSPENADKVKYQIYYAKKIGVPISISLKETLENAMYMLENKTMNRI